MSEYYLIHQDRYKYILKRVKELNLPHGAKILDVGCFPLDLFKSLKDMGFDMYGISSEHEKVNQKNIIPLNIESDKMPFKADTFDLILFSEVMEHMLYDPQVYLKKFHQVLKPGGFLLITTPNAVHIKHRLELMAGKNQNFPIFQFEGSPYHRHNREFTLSEVKTEVKKASFEVKKAEHFGAYNPMRQKLHQEGFGVKIGKALVFYPSQLVPELRDSLFVLAQK